MLRLRENRMDLFGLEIKCVFLQNSLLRQNISHPINSPELLYTARPGLSICHQPHSMGKEISLCPVQVSLVVSAVSVWEFYI